MKSPTKLIVLGAETPLGAEIARLAVAISYEVVTTAAEAPVDEPWIHGVDWRGARLEELGTADAIVVVGAALEPEIVTEFAEEAGIRRLVFVDQGDAASVSADSSGNSEVVVLRPGHVSGDPEVADAGLPISQVAMAALRCSVEDDRRGVYGPDEVAHIGDAMMIQ